MKLLLDTHTFLWWDNNLPRLSPLALTLCQDSANTMLLSMVSVWELQIKLQLGKLTLPLPLAEIVAGQQAAGVEVLPIRLAHVLGLDALPLHHKDPFDRLLVAQARSEGAVLLSSDTTLAQYPVDVRW